MTERGGRPCVPDYGLDAPKVVRNLLVLGSLGLGLWLSVALRLWSGVLRTPPLAGVSLVFPLSRMGLWVGSGLLAMGFWMIWSSRVGKVRGRERLLDRIPWTGKERVLDVGCGRGLMLVGAAKRLTAGKATGVDIWQAEDLSGNRPEATLENARCEDVGDRVDVRTADMRELPFPDASFEVVVSSAAIHNLYKAGDRQKAIREIARVLRARRTRLDRRHSPRRRIRGRVHTRRMFDDSTRLARGGPGSDRRDDGLAPAGHAPRAQGRLKQRRRRRHHGEAGDRSLRLRRPELLLLRRAAC